MTAPVPPVTVFGSVPFATPWLTEHNLAAALARRTRVTWIDPPMSPLTPVKALRDGRPRAARVDHDAIAVRRPVVLPPMEHPLAKRLSAPLLRAQVRALRRASPDTPVLMARGPGPVLDLLRARPSVYVVKDWNSAGARLLGRRTEADIERSVVATCRRCDLVCAVTERLRDTLRERGVESVLLRHGFAAETAPAYDAPPEPEDLAGLPRPIVGYVGRIDDRLDFAAVGAVADRHPDGTVLLVGPLGARISPESVALLERRPNVRMIGARPRTQLPGYLTRFDVCLLPYREGPWGEHGSPLKLWEYLYAGPPIVGSGYAVLREYAEWVDYGEPRALPELVERALGRRDDAAVARRRAFALANTWDDRVDELLALLPAA